MMNLVWKYFEVGRDIFAATEAVQADSSSTFHMQKKNKNKRMSQTKRKGCKD